MTWDRQVIGGDIFLYCEEELRVNIDRSALSTNDQFGLFSSISFCFYNLNLENPSAVIVGTPQRNLRFP